MSSARTNSANAPASSEKLGQVTGVQLMQGVGHQPAKGFWADAWSRTLRRPGAAAGVVWICIVGFFAVFAPLIANGRPILMRVIEDGEVVATRFPMFAGLTAVDLFLIIGTPVALLWAFAGKFLPAHLAERLPTSFRLTTILTSAIQVGLMALLAVIVAARFSGLGVSDAMREMEQSPRFVPIASILVAIAAALPFLMLSPVRSLLARALVAGGIAAAGAVILMSTWKMPLEGFTYRQREARGEIRAIYTLIPFSPGQVSTALGLKQPGSTPYIAVAYGIVDNLARELGVGGFRDDPRWEPRRSSARLSLADIPMDDDLAALASASLRINAQDLPRPPAAVEAEIAAARSAGDLTSAADLIDWLQSLRAPTFLLGADSLGQDALSQMLHACRLSISIGLVSTGIAVIIGVTIGALMGYFGGWVDLLLFRVVEIFMAVPVLFLLIVAAAVLPRNTYVMMAIIGCFTWTGAARFVRAEFYKLRGQDFVQSARAVGLPLRSVLFRHMLPNGVTPVLVDASFLIAVAILIEAIISFLGFGPANQPSWGRLLADSTNQVGSFVWWLAVFPGAAIFLTVLSYNLIGEALRDAIDPKLKKARV